MKWRARDRLQHRAFYTAAMREPMPEGFVSIGAMVREAEKDIVTRLRMRRARKMLGRMMPVSEPMRARLLRGDGPRRPWKKEPQR